MKASRFEKPFVFYKIKFYKVEKLTNFTFQTTNYNESKKFAQF